MHVVSLTSSIKFNFKFNKEIKDLPRLQLFWGLFEMLLLVIHKALIVLLEGQCELNNKPWQQDPSPPWRNIQVILI